MQGASGRMAEAGYSLPFAESHKHSRQCWPGGGKCFLPSEGTKVWAGEVDTPSGLHGRSHPTQPCSRRPEVSPHSQATQGLRQATGSSAWFFQSSRWADQNHRQKGPRGQALPAEWESECRDTALGPTIVVPKEKPWHQLSHHHAPPPPMLSTAVTS